MIIAKQYLFVCKYVTYMHVVLFVCLYVKYAFLHGLIEPYPQKCRKIHGLIQPTCRPVDRLTATDNRSHMQPQPHAATATTTGGGGGREGEQKRGRAEGGAPMRAISGKGPPSK